MICNTISSYNPNITIIFHRTSRRHRCNSMLSTCTRTYIIHGYICTRTTSRPRCAIVNFYIIAINRTIISTPFNSSILNSSTKTFINCSYYCATSRPSARTSITRYLTNITKIRIIRTTSRHTSCTTRYTSGM